MATIKLNRGYTLIELVVVVGLVGMLSVGMLSVFLASLRGSSRAQAEAEVRSQGDFAIVKMERALRQADAAPNCPSATQISYAIARQAKNFRLVDGTPATIQDESNVSLFGPNVSVANLSFICPSPADYGAGAVTISFSLTANGKMNQTVTQAFKTTVAIRSVQ